MGLGRTRSLRAAARNFFRVPIQVDWRNCLPERALRRVQLQTSRVAAARTRLPATGMHTLSEGQRLTFDAQLDAHGAKVINLKSA